MPELNIPQGKMFCAILLLQLTVPHSALKHNMTLNSIYYKNQLGIILQSNSNTLMLYSTKLDSHVRWLVQSFVVFNSYFFIASMFRSLLTCLDLDSQANPKLICDITELNEKGAQCKYSKVASYISFHSVGPKLTGTN